MSLLRDWHPRSGSENGAAAGGFQRGTVEIRDAPAYVLNQTLALNHAGPIDASGASDREGPLGHNEDVICSMGFRSLNVEKAHSHAVCCYKLRLHYVYTKSGATGSLDFEDHGPEQTSAL